MSLNSLTTNRVAREVARKGSVQKGITVASEDSLGPDRQDVDNALSALVEYVPAETITMYLATIAALPALAKAITEVSVDAKNVYWLFALLTPVLYALIYAGKRKAAGESRWPGLKEWPWWPMIAATVAFMAWGLTVPDGPFLAGDEGRVVAGLIAIFISTLLGVAGRFFAPAP